MAASEATVLAESGGLGRPSSVGSPGRGRRAHLAGDGWDLPHDHPEFRPVNDPQVHETYGRRQPLGKTDLGSPLLRVVEFYRPLIHLRVDSLWLARSMDPAGQARRPQSWVEVPPADFDREAAVAVVGRARDVRRGVRVQQEWWAPSMGAAGRDQDWRRRKNAALRRQDALEELAWVACPRGELAADLAEEAARRLLSRGSSAAVREAAARVLWRVERDLERLINTLEGYMDVAAIEAIPEAEKYSTPFGAERREGAKVWRVRAREEATRPDQVDEVTLSPVVFVPLDSVPEADLAGDDSSG
jgi:hypothetical protein